MIMTNKGNRRHVAHILILNVWFILRQVMEYILYYLGEDYIEAENFISAWKLFKSSSGLIFLDWYHVVAV